jgi:hypothetical protein
MAFFVDSVTRAAQGKQTAPDWWQELKRAEQREHELSGDGLALFSRLRLELFGETPDATLEPLPPRPSLTPLSAILSGKELTDKREH